MTLFDKYYSKQEKLIENSLSICPNNKKNVIRFDNLKKRSGYMQFFIAKNIDEIHFDDLERRSSLYLLEENPTKDYYDNISTVDKNKNIKKLHDKGQILLSEIISDTYSLVRQNRDKYQSQLVELAGYTKENLNDNNFAFVTIFDIMQNQGMINKVDKYGHYKIGRGGNTYLRCIEEKPYIPFSFIETGRSGSKLEAELADYLRKENIDFEQQVTFKGCCYRRPLPFDFNVKFSNGDELLIEIDGRQHYEYIKYFHPTIADFKLQQKRDRIKDKYAAEHDVEFLRIRYDENIVKKFNNKIIEMDIKEI